MAVTELPTDRDKLVMVAEFACISPSALFNYWVVPELLQRWWPPEAEIEPGTGGAYHLFWARMNWHLRGSYSVFDPGRALAFTWQWDHYPVVKNVVVAFDLLNEDSTRMTLMHSPYGDQSRIG